MPTPPWRDDSLRQEAERLVDSYGHLWPDPCEHATCSKPFPRSFRKDQTKSSGFNIRRFRCAGCKSTLGIKSVLDKLRPIQQDPSAAADRVSALLQTIHPAAAPVRVQPPKLNQSLHLSDLDSMQEDDNMSDTTNLDNEEDSSLLIHYPSNRPQWYQTPPPQQQQMVLGTQVFNSPLPHQYLTMQSPSLQSIHPSQFSPFSYGTSQQQPSQFPSSLHPSQWSPISPGTPLTRHQSEPPVITQVVSTPQASQPWSPQPPSQGPSSVALGKRPYLDASEWQQKHQRMDTTAVLHQQLAAANQANQTLQDQMQALIAEISHLRQELQAVKTQPQPAVVVAPAAAAAVAPVVTPVVAAIVAPAAAPVAAPAAALAVVPVSTYAGAARQALTDAQKEIIKSMKPPPRPFRARQPETAAPKPDGVPVRVYFSGVQSGPLKTLKEKLRALRVRTSQIYNISFIGKSICEFMVDAGYQAKFIESMQSFTFRHLPDFDPAVPQDPNVSEETRDKLKEAYARRLTSMATTTNRGFVREAFLTLLADAGAPIPADLPPLTAVNAPDADTNQTNTEMELVAEDTTGSAVEGTVAAPIASDSTNTSSHE